MALDVFSRGWGARDLLLGGWVEGFRINSWWSLARTAGVLFPSLFALLALHHNYNVCWQHWGSFRVMRVLKDFMTWKERCSFKELRSRQLSCISLYCSHKTNPNEFAGLPLRFPAMLPVSSLRAISCYPKPIIAMLLFGRAVIITLPPSCRFVLLKGSNVKTQGYPYERKNPC